MDFYDDCVQDDMVASFGIHTSMKGLDNFYLFDPNTSCDHPQGACSLMVVV